MGWIRGKTLGEGSYGLVSKATNCEEDEENSALPRVFAVKTVSLTDAQSLIKEEKILNQLQKVNCPFVVRSFGCDTTVEGGESFYNLLLEYAAGGSLNDLIQLTRGRGLPEHFVSHFTRSILVGLRHVHRLGYVHCDVKPQNVLLFGDDGFGSLQTAKLADFGSAKRVKDCSEDEEEEEEDGRLVRGTLVYAAPESVSRREYSPESDIWGLGCTVLKILTGKSPWNFPADALTEDVAAKIGWSNEIPDIPKLSKKARDFLKKCLIKDPRKRSSIDKLLNHPFLTTATAAAAPLAGKHRHRTGFTSMISCFHVPRHAVHVS